MAVKNTINKLQHIRNNYPSKNIENLETDKALYRAIKALDFAQWVAEEVIDEELWDLNSNGFAAIACRKLEKLGIVRANGDEWELIESEGKE